MFLKLNMAYYFGGVIALLCLAKIFAEPPKNADKE